MQDSGERRFRTKRLVGVPLLRTHLATRLAVGAEIGDGVHQRIVGAAVARDVALQRAELLGEPDLLILAQPLVPEAQHLISAEGTIHLAPGVRIQWLCQVKPDHLGAKHRR